MQEISYYSMSLSSFQVGQSVSGHSPTPASRFDFLCLEERSLSHPIIFILYSSLSFQLIRFCLRIPRLPETLARPISFWLRLRLSKVRSGFQLYDQSPLVFQLQPHSRVAKRAILAWSFIQSRQKRGLDPIPHFSALGLASTKRRFSAVNYNYTSNVKRGRMWKSLILQDRQFEKTEAQEKEIGILPSFRIALSH